MKKISCSFANHSGAEIGVNLNGESFIIPGNSVGASLFTKEINPGAVADIQAWITANHPYVVFTNNGNGVTEEENLFMAGASYPKDSDQEIIYSGTRQKIVTIAADGTTFHRIAVPDGYYPKSVTITIRDTTLPTSPIFLSTEAFIFSDSDVASPDNATKIIYGNGVTFNFAGVPGTFLGRIMAASGKTICLHFVE